MSLSDVQAFPDLRNIPLHRVGVNNVRYPIIWSDAHTTESTIGTFSLGIQLPSSQKGAHLSRFLSVLQKHHESDDRLLISLKSLPKLHAQILKELGADAGVIECFFTSFRTQSAPSSRQDSLSYDTVKMSIDGKIEANMTLTLGVTVTSLCPCSKEISHYGAHNQRSLIEVKLLLPIGESALSVQKLAQDIAAEGSCEIYNLLKRPDEKAVTERAYENPKFSEDIVRDIVLMLQKKYFSFQVIQISSTHLESIHQHDAFSIYQGE